jgi:hypothetical protein
LNLTDLCVAMQVMIDLAHAMTQHHRIILVSTGEKLDEGASSQLVRDISLRNKTRQPSLAEVHVTRRNKFITDGVACWCSQSAQTPGLLGRTPEQNRCPSSPSTCCGSAWGLLYCSHRRFDHMAWCR